MKQCNVCKHRVTNEMFDTFHSDQACRVCGSPVMVTYEEVIRKPKHKLNYVGLGEDSDFSSISICLGVQPFVATFKKGMSVSETVNQLRAMADKIDSHFGPDKRNSPPVRINRNEPTNREVPIQKTLNEIKELKNVTKASFKHHGEKGIEHVIFVNGTVDKEAIAKIIFKHTPINIKLTGDFAKHFKTDIGHFDTAFTIVNEEK